MIDSGLRLVVLASLLTHCRPLHWPLLLPARRYVWRRRLPAAGAVAVVACCSHPITHSLILPPCLCSCHSTALPAPSSVATGTSTERCCGTDGPSHNTSCPASNRCASSLGRQSIATLASLRHAVLQGEAVAALFRHDKFEVTQEMVRHHMFSASNKSRQPHPVGHEDQLLELGWLWVAKSDQPPLDTTLSTYLRKTIEAQDSRKQILVAAPSGAG